MPHTLLLADDSQTIQRVVELTFADEDIAVVAVDDGRQAIEFLNRTPPDIVLADIGMPGLGGYAVSRHVKNTPELAHIPVLLLVGAFDLVDRTEALEAGCAGVLTKPFEPQVIIRRVRELLERQKSGLAVSPEEASFEGVTAGPVERDGSLQTPRAPQTPADVEQYFEQLGQAFAALSGESQPGADVRPLSHASVRAQVTAPLEGTSPTPSPLVEAFTALLAAERAVTAGTIDPASPVTLAPPPVVDTGSVAEEVLRIVIARLPDQLTREMVAEVVAATAERLVREEIERIKSNIT